MSTPVNIEWRHGWFPRHSLDWDWRYWSLCFGLVYHHRKEIGVSFGFGPLFVAIGWEEEERCFEDGQDTGLGFAPVDGYSEAAPPPATPGRDE